MNKDLREKIKNNKEKIFVGVFFALVFIIIVFIYKTDIDREKVEQAKSKETQALQQKVTDEKKIENEKIEKYSKIANNVSEGTVVDFYKSGHYPNNPGMYYVTNANEKYALIISDITSEPKDKNGKSIELGSEIKVNKSELIKDSVLNKYIVTFLVKNSDIEVVNKDNTQNNATNEKVQVTYDTGITYNQLARTPKEYIDKKVTFNGQVVQTMDDGGETYIRLAVDGNYDNIILANYYTDISDVRILEKDNVTIKGTSVGIKSYTSNLGKKISIPGVMIDKIELNK